MIICTIVGLALPLQLGADQPQTLFPAHSSDFQQGRTSAQAGARVAHGLHGLDLSVHRPASTPTWERPTCRTTPPPSNDTAAQFDLWPNGEVPYEFDQNASVANRSDALAAMQVIEALADVDFVPRDDEDGYLLIRDGAENSSSQIGYTGGQVTVTMFNWDWQGILLHELSHALGFIHEHQRSDRDDFVQIQMQNVQVGAEEQFTLHAQTHFLLGPYDYSSIMHYDECSFSVCCPAGTACGCAQPCQTISAPGFEDVMGQRTELTALDVYGLRAMYWYPDWRFVDPENGDCCGSGWEPWRELADALTLSPAGSTVFVLPGTYSASGTFDTPLTIAAPIGGVTVR